ncbi:MAG: rhodanese-like domain-containing protein, partial [Pseudomonadota bacterium]
MRRPAVGTAVLAGVIAALPAAAQQAGPQPVATDDTCRVPYRVVRGDTLGDIAERAYGRVEDWRRVYNENRRAVGDDPWVLEVGTVLSVPCRAVPNARSVIADFERNAAAGSQPEVTVTALDPFDRDTLAPLSIPSWHDAEGAGAVALAPGVLSLIPPDMAEALIDGGDAPQVVDLGPAQTWSDGVLPGAACIDAAAWQAAATRGGPVALGALIGRGGLQDDRPILLVHDGAGALGDAALVHWLLRDAGLDQVAIMAGGRAGWTTSDRQTEPCAQEIVPTALTDAQAGPETARPGAPRPAPVAAAIRIGRIDVDTASCSEFEQRAESLGEAALDAAARLTALDLSWGRVPIAVYAEDDRDAALAWFALSHIAGLQDVEMVPSQAWRAAEGYEQAEALAITGNPCDLLSSAPAYTGLVGEAVVVFDDAVAGPGVRVTGAAPSPAPTADTPRETAPVGNPGAALPARLLDRRSAAPSSRERIAANGRPRALGPAEDARPEEVLLPLPDGQVSTVRRGAAGRADGDRWPPVTP